jgi:hypothetical protein
MGDVEGPSPPAIAPGHPDRRGTGRRSARGGLKSRTAPSLRSRSVWRSVITAWSTSGERRRLGAPVSRNRAPASAPATPRHRVYLARHLLQHCPGNAPSICPSTAPATPPASATATPGMAPKTGRGSGRPRGRRRGGRRGWPPDLRVLRGQPRGWWRLRPHPERHYRDRPGRRPRHAAIIAGIISLDFHRTRSINNKTPRAGRVSATWSGPPPQQDRLRSLGRRMGPRPRRPAEKHPGSRPSRGAKWVHLSRRTRPTHIGSHHGVLTGRERGQDPNVLHF